MATSPSTQGFIEVQGCLEVRLGPALLRVDALAPDILRIRVAPQGHLPEDASWVVPADVRAARAAVADASDERSAGFRTAALTVRVDRATLAVTISDPAGRTILADHVVAGGAVAGGAVAPFAVSGEGFTLRKALHPSERVFALGDKTGPLDRRGRAFTNWTTDQLVSETADPLYKAVPLVIGAGGPAGAWALLLDNPWRSTFDVGHADPDVLAIGADGGPLDTYVVVGDGVKAVVERGATLTGHPPMPPKWAFGYQQSRYSYGSAAQVREIAARLRRDGFPADVIWLDIGFQDRDRPFTVDPRTYPDLPGLIAELRGEGFHTVVITDLHVAKLPGQGYAPYDSGVAADAFIRDADGGVFTGEVWPGPAVFPDFARADVRAWWGTLYADFAAMGIGGFWNDMNEPSVFDTPDKTVPSDAVQRIATPGFTSRATRHAEVHNLTGLLNARATYEGLLALRPDERPFVMTRSTFAGGQRWAVTWTGDNDATWAQLKLGVAQTLNLGLSGFTYTAVDVGGFLGAPTPELLTRWFQVQAFMPLLRDHTATGTPPQEPWVHGPAHEAIRRRAVAERYRLLPTFYALADAARRTGAPIVRPVFYDHPALLDAPRDMSMAFTLGANLLVAASPTPDSPAPYDVCLPHGRWFDYWSGDEVVPRAIAGGPYRAVSETPRPDHLPVYVREGAVVVRQALTRSLAEPPDGPLDLDLWPGGEGHTTLYDDDGHSLAHARGVFMRQRVSHRATADGVVLTFDAREGTFEPAWRELRVTVRGWAHPAAILDAPSAPAVVVADGTARFVIPAPRAATTIRLGPSASHAR